MDGDIIYQVCFVLYPNTFETEYKMCQTEGRIIFCCSAKQIKSIHFMVLVNGFTLFILVKKKNTQKNKYPIFFSRFTNVFFSSPNPFLTFGFPESVPLILDFKFHFLLKICKNINAYKCMECYMYILLR